MTWAYLMDSGLPVGSSPRLHQLVEKAHSKLNIRAWTTLSMVASQLIVADRSYCYPHSGFRTNNGNDDDLTSLFPFP